MSDYASMRRWIAPLLIVGFIISMYFEDRANDRVTRVELPGFSVELPRGEVLSTNPAPASGTYRLDVNPSVLGWIIRRELSNPQLGIQWISQAATLDEWRKNYLPVMIQALGGKTEQHRVLKEQAVDDQRWLTVIGVGKEELPFGVGIMSCDEKFHVMVIYGRYRSPERQAAELGKILRSVRCGVRQENRNRLSAAVRLPEKFGRTSDADFEGYKSLDGEVLIVNFTNGDVLRDRGIYKQVAMNLLASSLGEQIPDSDANYLPDPELRHRASLIRVRLKDPERHAYIGSQYCELQEQTLMFMWTAPRGSDARAAERLAQVGCPGDGGGDVRAFHDLAAQACAGGNQAACTMHDTVD
jgi:hypothetical protein